MKKTLFLLAVMLAAIQGFSQTSTVPAGWEATAFKNASLPITIVMPSSYTIPTTHVEVWNNGVKLSDSTDVTVSGDTIKFTLTKKQLAPFTKESYAYLTTVIGMDTLYLLGVKITAKYGIGIPSGTSKVISLPNIGNVRVSVIGDASTAIAAATRAETARDVSIAARDSARVILDSTNVNLLSQLKVGSIAALRALPVTRPSYQVIQGGRSGFFYLDPADASSADDGNMIIRRGPTDRFKRPAGPVLPGYFGAIGDNSTNDTTPVADALAVRKELYLDKDFKVTSFVNKFGVPILGPGRIFKAITGGDQQLNSYADVGQHIFGQEYIHHWAKKLRTRSSGTSVIGYLSGDSTTDGAAADTEYKPAKLLQDLCNADGIPDVTWINGGVSGSSIDDWLTNLTTYKAIAKDVWIIRHGINSPPLGHTVSQFLDKLRTGLTSIRADKTTDQLTIILMTPNSVSDTPNGRDEKYFEQINQGVKTLAREFECSFIDTYALWPDSRGAAGLWMDAPYSPTSPEIAVHPTNDFNTWIYSKVYDFLVPTAMKMRLGFGPVPNVPGSARTPLASDLPSTYTSGFSMGRALASNGFPLEGSYTMFKHADNIVTQINTPFQSANQDKAPYVRYNVNAGNTWGRWISMGVQTVLAAETTPAASTAYTSYPVGVSTWTVLASGGWPVDGQMTSTKNADGYTFQRIVSNKQANYQEHVRSTYYDGSTTSWTPFIPLKQGTPERYLYKKSSWTSLSDFVVQGSTPTVSSGEIAFTGGTGVYTNTLEVPIISSLDDWKVKAVVKIGTKDGVSYGFGIGKRSTGGYGAGDILIHFLMGTPGGGGFRLVSNTAHDQVGLSTGSINFEVGEDVEITLQRKGYVVTANCRNLTTAGITATMTYTYSTAPGTSYSFENVGRFCVFNLGGDFHLKSFEVSTTVPVAPNLAVVGDSKTQGYSVTAQSKRFTDIIGQTYKHTVTLGSGSDRTIEVLSRLPEIISLAPKKVLLALGSNDVRQAAESTATYYARYDNIVSQLQAAGIQVYHLLLYETAISLTALNSHITSTFPAYRIIDAATPMSAGGALQADGVHPNDTGAQLIADTVVNSFKLPNESN